MKQFRIATYNIHKGRGLDGRRRVARIARVLAEIKPDILAVQEVVSHEGRSIEDHQASYLADQFEYFYAIGETRKHRGGIYGNVTLSRSPGEKSGASSVQMYASATRFCTSLTCISARHTGSGGRKPSGW